MTAVLATLRVIKEEGLCENAALQGAHLTERLEELAKRHSATVAGVRGRGLMLGFKLKDLARGLLERTVLKKLGAASAALFSQYVALRLMEDHHIVTQAAGNDMAVLKVMPPLSVTREAVDRFADALDVVLSSGGHAKALYTLATELIRHRRK
jgi:ornithine--oxo-acid transaminase